jgi:hypothetical protein
MAPSVIQDHLSVAENRTFMWCIDIVVRRDGLDAIVRTR